VYHFGYIVGNPLLSERDGNSSTVMRHEFGISSVGNPLLSERDGNPSFLKITSMNLKSMSETHYSLKEMETGLVG